ncbi:MAG: DUF1700 domain-containing protein [Lachnospiraceae bacterium]|nr:DUF1700 domain-containing protein [Lachnospiraceae bacterium]
MNRIEFMKELEQLLSGVSESEKAEAMAYYNDYFDDAGEENEADVISSLGSPREVYDTILEGLGQKPAGENNDNVTGNQEVGKHIIAKDDPQRNLKIALLILVGIILCPVWVPVLFSVLGTVLGFMFAGLGILLAVTCVGLALFVAGVGLLIVSFAQLIAAPIAAIFIMGISLMLATAGAAIFILSIWLWKTVVPAIFRLIVKICRMPFERREGQTA